jgi:hypothetical protein
MSAESEFAYHRGRVDAAQREAGRFIVLLALFVFAVGDKFEPLQQGASFWMMTALVWTPETRVWEPAELSWLTQEVLEPPEEFVITPSPVPPGAEDSQDVVDTGRYVLTRMGPRASGHRLTREIYPTSYSVLFVAGSLIVWGCLYQSARQHHVQASTWLDRVPEPKPRLRVWAGVRTAMLVVLLVVLIELVVFLA